MGSPVGCAFWTEPEKEEEEEEERQVERGERPERYEEPKLMLWGSSASSAGMEARSTMRTRLD